MSLDLTPISAVANVLSGAEKIAYDLLHPDQRVLIDKANAAAQDDGRTFVEAVLSRNTERVNLLLGGLRSTILVQLTESESAELRSIVPNIDGSALVGLYLRARSADLAERVCEILQTASQPK